MGLKDSYETTWRARAAEHGLTEVDWYIYNRLGELERFADLAEAERKTLEYHGPPSCGRGANCSDIAPFLGSADLSGRLSSVEAILEDLYDDD